MRKLLTILMCTIFASFADAQDTCGSPAMAPRDSASAEVSNAGTFYFYPTPFSSCVGTVIAYEFCYRFTQTSAGPPDDVVSIVVMESVDDDYSVVWTGIERQDRSCITDMDIGPGVVRCCGRTDLAIEDMFSVTASHAYGFVIPAITQNNLLTLETNAAGFLLATPLSLSGSLPSVGSTLTPAELGISGMLSQTLRQRSVQFIIQQPLPDPSLPPDGTTGVSTLAVIGIVIGLLLVIIIILAALMILFVFRCKKQKTVFLEQSQEIVLEGNDTMINNDAERNAPYMIMTNNAIIPVAQNEAYGPVETELEAGNSLNREDMHNAVYVEPQGQTAQDQGIQEHIYEYVH